MLRLGGREDTQASEALGWLAGAAALAPRLWASQALGFVADYTGFGLLAGESCSWWWKTSSLLPNNSLRPDLDLVSPLNL